MSVLDDGYEIIGEFLTHEQLTAMNTELEALGLPSKVGGIRNAENKFATIRDLANSRKLHKQAKKYLSGTVNLVRAILFNKTIDNNWLVTWHQDRTIAVSEKFEMNGWGPWSVKEGVQNVQPPVTVLNQMITFRIHLDDASIDNGCLKVLPESHKLGILDSEAIQEYVRNNRPVVCQVPAGSVLLMRPHILHSSSKASRPSQRRVIHLEYSDFKLPSGISWV